MAERYKEPEIWKDIEGCGKYQVSSFGNVRNAKTGRILKRKGKNKDQVALRDDKGRKKYFSVITLVGRAFLGKIPDNYNYYRKNGIKGDYCARNIAVEKGWSGRRNFICENRKNSKQVARIDHTGEIVDVYASIHDASRNTGLSSAAIRNRCRGYYIYGQKKRCYRSVFASDGYCYAFDDEDCIMSVLLKMEEELVQSPVFVDTRGYFQQKDFEIPEIDTDLELLNVGGGI